MTVRSMKNIPLAWLICCASIAHSPSAESAEPIKIGAVLPFSGGVELYGRQAKLGLDLAAKDINAAGGILGRPVEVIYEDDKTRPDPAVDATRKLVEREGVLAVVGPITSRNLDAMAPVLESLKTPLLYATNYEGGKCGRYVFSFSTVPNQELAQLLPYMNQTFGNTYFLLGADRPWPHKMFEAAEPIIARLGGKVVGTEYTLGNETDFCHEGKGPAVRAERRRSGFHPAGGRRRTAEGHDDRVSRTVRNRSWRVRRQGPEHVRRGALRRH
jgi:urea transport system substrate-binding protein